MVWGTILGEKKLKAWKLLAKLTGVKAPLCQGAEPLQDYFSSLEGWLYRWWDWWWACFPLTPNNPEGCMWICTKTGVKRPTIVFPFSVSHSACIGLELKRKGRTKWHYLCRHFVATWACTWDRLRQQISAEGMSGGRWKNKKIREVPSIVREHTGGA